jgi:hypothetical protein
MSIMVHCDMCGKAIDYRYFVNDYNKPWLELRVKQPSSSGTVSVEFCEKCCSEMPKKLFRLLSKLSKARPEGELKGEHAKAAELPEEQPADAQILTSEEIK